MCDLKGRLNISKLIKYHFIFALVIFFSINVYADEIKLKDGRIVNGKIIERAHDSIKVDSGIGINLTYYLDQVDSIDGQSVVVVIKAVSTPPSSLTQDKADLHDQPHSAFIWEVRSATTTSYILGSIHIADASFYPLAAPIEKAFNRADVLVVETDTSAIDPKLEEELKDKAMYKDGRTLKDDISPETLSMLKSFVDQFKIDVTPFLIMRPWMVSLTLGNIAAAAMGLDPLFGIDAHFIRLAYSREKQIQSLEDVKEQVDLLSGFMDQDVVLKQTLKELMQERDEAEDMISIWKSGNNKAMEKITFDTVGMDESISREYFERFLYKRNEAMINKIDGYLQDKKVYFVVVGAAHLLGERGILNALQKKGYRLRQL